MRSVANGSAILRVAGCAMLLILANAGMLPAQQSTGSGGAAQANSGSGARPSPERVHGTLHLNNTTQQNEQNEIVTGLRNMLDVYAKVFLVPSKNAILIEASAEQVALAKRLLNEVDQPKSSYRLTYTLTELDSGKRVGVQHFSMVLASNQRTQVKQGSRVPLMVGFSPVPNSTQTEVTYVDVGMNFEATLSDASNSLMLRTRVEQSSIAEGQSMAEKDPVIRQTLLEGTSMLALGKPLVLGSLDVPGSTRHVDVEVVLEMAK